MTTETTHPQVHAVTPWSGPCAAQGRCFGICWGCGVHFQTQEERAAAQRRPHPWGTGPAVLLCQECVNR